MGRETGGALRFDDSQDFRATFKKGTRRRRDRPSVRGVKVERGNRQNGERDAVAKNAGTSEKGRKSGFFVATIESCLKNVPFKSEQKERRGENERRLTESAASRLERKTRLNGAVQRVDRSKRRKNAVAASRQGEERGERKRSDAAAQNEKTSRKSAFVPTNSGQNGEPERA